jgi:mannose-6-phosphate isomerase-like protein (cupin superfamily)
MNDKIVNLTCHELKRGFLVELFKIETLTVTRRTMRDQVTLVEFDPGKGRDGHKHLKSNEHWIFIAGRGRVRLGYEDDGQVEVFVDATGRDFKVIMVPAGTGHEILNTDQELPLRLLFLSDRWYDPNEPDDWPWEWER